jgi:cytochrome c oxidase subunit 1
MADQTLPIAGTVDVTPRRRSTATLLEWLHGWVVTVDHKRLGILYLVYGIFFLLVAGAEAIAIRIQLAWPGMHFLSPELYNEMFTMHGTTMVFLVGMTIIFGFANYLVPLMIGARDMAFPRRLADCCFTTALLEASDCTAWARRPMWGGGRMLR